jgi:hypothetical protein
VLGGQVAIDQGGKLIPLDKAIVILVGIGEDMAETELDFAASVLTIVSDDCESIMQQVQVLCRQVHNILFH